MAQPTVLIVCSAVIAFMIAFLWFDAPLLPALAGSAGAGLLLHLRMRRR
jgi:hypothetical protein